MVRLYAIRTARLYLWVGHNYDETPLPEKWTSWWDTSMMKCPTRKMNLSSRVRSMPHSEQSRLICCWMHAHSHSTGRGYPTLTAGGSRHWTCHAPLGDIQPQLCTWSKHNPIPQRFQYRNGCRVGGSVLSADSLAINGQKPTQKPLLTEPPVFVFVTSTLHATVLSKICSMKTLRPMINACVSSGDVCGHNTSRLNRDTVTQTAVKCAPNPSRHSTQTQFTFKVWHSHCVQTSNMGDNQIHNIYLYITATYFDYF